MKLGCAAVDRSFRKRAWLLAGLFTGHALLLASPGSGQVDSRRLLGAPRAILVGNTTTSATLRARDADPVRTYAWAVCDQAAASPSGDPSCAAIEPEAAGDCRSVAASDRGRQFREGTPTFGQPDGRRDLFHDDGAGSAFTIDGLFVDTRYRICVGSYDGSTLRWQYDFPFKTLPAVIADESLAPPRTRHTGADIDEALLRCGTGGMKGCNLYLEAGLYHDVALHQDKRADGCGHDTNYEIARTRIAPDGSGRKADLSDGLYLQGAGSDRTILRPPMPICNYVLEIDGGHGPSQSPDWDFGLRWLQIDGLKRSQNPDRIPNPWSAGGVAIRSGSTSYLRGGEIHDLYVHHVLGPAIAVRNAHGTRILRNRLEHGGCHESEEPCHPYWRFREQPFSHAGRQLGGYGVNVTSDTARIEVAGNVCRSFTKMCFQAFGREGEDTDSTDHVFSRNVAIDAGGAGLAVVNSRGVRIEDNLVTGSGHAGVSQNSGFGVLLAGATVGTVVRGNWISESEGAGIRINGFFEETSGRTYPLATTVEANVFTGNCVSRTPDADGFLTASLGEIFLAGDFDRPESGSVLLANNIITTSSQVRGQCRAALAFLNWNGASTLVEGLAVQASGPKNGVEFHRSRAITVRSGAVSGSGDSAFGLQLDAESKGNRLTEVAIEGFVTPSREEGRAGGNLLPSP